MKYNGAALPDLGESVEKFSHHLKLGQRVRVKETGHRGKISNLDDFNRVHVELDNGHFIHGRPNEFEPEDWPQPQSSSADDAPFPAKLTRAHIAVLTAAAEAGKLSPRDEGYFRVALDHFQKGFGTGATDPFGQLETSAERTLRELAERYAGSVDLADLAKRARGSIHVFKVGDRVKDQITGRTAKITRASITHCELDFGDGVTGLSLLEYLEPVAA
jgi:hypothetical protein